MTESIIGHPDQRWGCISWAQHGDDFMLVNLFELLGIEHPSYLDIGAHHPTVISNTKMLYDLGSCGINVEANPFLTEAFNRERPIDLNISMGVGPVAGEATFYMYSDSSGRNTFSSQEVTHETKMMVQKEIKLPIITIDQLVQSIQHADHGTYPHLLSIDIEGLDFDVLKGASFHADSNGPCVICVETRRNETARMAAMLERKGYFLYCRMGENLFFVRNTFRNLVY